MLSHINIGYGEDMTISEVANLIKGGLVIRGESFSDVFPSQTVPQKLMDSSLLSSSGWRPKNLIDIGLKTYTDFLADC